MSRNSRAVAGLERVLAAHYHREHCVVFSRGASALYCLFASIARGQASEVIMPSLLCMSPAFSAMYAGAKVHFADARYEDFQVDPADVERLLDSHDDISTVLVPHLFGCASDIVHVAELCRARGVMVVEDAAQAQGLTIGDRLAGSIGDVSLLSFGHTKIVDAGGGAALLFDKAEYEGPLRACAESLPSPVPNLAALGRDYREAYYALAPVFRRNSEVDGLYSGFSSAFRDLYLYSGIGDEVIARIVEGLDDLDYKISRRREIGELYRTHLRHPLIRHPASHAGDVPWRYSFVIDGVQSDALASEVRAQGVDVSNWYPPLHRMLLPRSRALPVADAIGRSLWNLWTEPEMSDSDVLHAVEAMLNGIDRYGH